MFRCFNGVWWKIEINGEKIGKMTMHGESGGEKFCILT